MNVNMKTGFILTLFTAVMTCGCRHVGPPSRGLNRAVYLAREGVMGRYPDVTRERLRLDKIIALDKKGTSNDWYLVTFEDVKSIAVTTNGGQRYRSVRQLDAHVKNGLVTRVGEGRNTRSIKVRADR
jgi:hypothetical protein